jgi:outer membrane protein assembly factor BamB
LSKTGAERCDYCGAVANPRRAAANEVQGAIRDAAQRARRTSFVYVAVVLGISAVSALIALVGQLGMRGASKSARIPKTESAQSRANAPSKDRLGLSQILAEVPKAQEGPAVLFATYRDPDHPLVLLDAKTGKARWIHGAFSKSLSKHQVELSGDKIFIADQNRFIALNVRDGSLAWQASLMVDYKSWGNGIYAAGNRVAVLLQDGTTQVFEVATGRTVWTTRENPPPQHILGAGNHIVQFGRSGRAHGRDTEISVLDLDSSEVQQRFDPRCSTHSIIPPNAPSPSDPLWFSEDGNDVYFFYGINRYCAERWDLRTGKRVWQLNRADRYQMPSTTYRDHPFVVGPEVLVYAAGNNVYAIRRRDGELRKVIDSADMHLEPRYLHGGHLILAASATWDDADCNQAKNCAIWSIDLDKGEVSWRYSLPSLDGHALSSGAPRFVGAFSDESFDVAEVAGNDQVVLDRLNLQTGVSRFHKAFKLGSTFRAPSLAWFGNTLWAQGGGTTAIDTAASAIQFQLE